MEFTATRVEINLVTGEIHRRPIPPAATLAFIGGRGLNMSYLLDHLGPGIDPFSPEAPLLFGAGPFVGTSFPGGARFNISARSPQTRILGDSNAGGFFGPEMRFAGVDQLVITGRAPHPTYLFLHDGKVELRDARGLRGEDIVETTKAIQEELGERRIQVASIGPAAENGVRFSGVFTNFTRAAARTGMGTVMAAKNLKAVVVRGTLKVPLADQARFDERTSTGSCR